VSVPTPLRPGPVTSTLLLLRYLTSPGDTTVSV
jgi:hypothetical protein